MQPNHIEEKNLSEFRIFRVNVQVVGCLLKPYSPCYGIMFKWIVKESKYVINLEFTNYD